MATPPTWIVGSFPNSETHRSMTHFHHLSNSFISHYITGHHHLIIRHYLFAVLYVLRSLQLMKAYEPKCPVFNE